MLNTISNKANGMSNDCWRETKRKSVDVPEVVLAHITPLKMWLENNAADGQTMVRWVRFLTPPLNHRPVGTPL